MDFKKISVVTLGLGTMLLTACSSGLSYEQACEHVRKNFTHGSQERKEIKKATYEWDFSATKGANYIALIKIYVNEYYGSTDLKGSKESTQTGTIDYLNIDGFIAQFPSKEVADNMHAKFSADGKKLITSYATTEPYGGYDWDCIATAKTTDEGLPFETKEEFKNAHFNDLGDGNITGYTIAKFEY